MFLIIQLRFLAVWLIAKIQLIDYYILGLQHLVYWMNVFEP